MRPRRALSLVLTLCVALLAAASPRAGAQGPASSSSSSSSSHSGSIAPAAGETTVSTVGDRNVTRRCFPEGFLFGSATASYQVEGGWNETGRSPSIWDDFCRAEKDVACANVADDFVHRYKDDIRLMVDTGLDSFRFSVSWSRVMRWDPSSRRMVPNAPGVAFYHAVIDELLRANLVPIVTLYHWDLPSALQSGLDPPGWLHDDIVGHFVDYAELMFREYGAKVDFWTTFNEPWTFTTQGYGNGVKAPGFKHSTTNTYRVAHNVLLSHARAVERFRALKGQEVIHQAAQIGIVLNADYSYPLDPMSELDVAAAERKMQFVLGWFLTPLVSGEYPSIMRERAGTRLPNFTRDEAELVRGSYDLFMLNHYSSRTVTDCKSPHSKVKCGKQTMGWERDLGVDETRIPHGARPSSVGHDGKLLCSWFTGYPKGYLDTIRWMHAQDPSAKILLTENGWCGNETIDNQDQLWYYQRYIEQVHEAITVEKIPIIGYTAWSFVDNYEWGSFEPRFGLYYVNFTSLTGSKAGWTPAPGDLARIPRTAAKWYAELARSGCMELAPEPPLPTGEEPTGADEGSLLSRLASNLLIGAVVAPIIFAAWVSLSVLRRRTALYLRPEAANAGTTANESTPLLRP